MKKWIISADKESPQIEGISPSIVGLLESRGICGEAEIKEFLSDKPVRTHDPFLLKGMDAAVEKIKMHIEKGSKICIYGDYDVDGVTACCLLFEFLTNITKKLEIYIPDRREEGYGLNKAAVKKIRDGGCDLIITVDCGITSYEEVTYAKETGLEIIVTDHHTPQDKPLGCITINPKQKDCPYPFKELCGCGLAYKLVQALQRNMKLDRKTLVRGLDLVAIATVADIVPLLDENRTLVKYGLKELNKKKRIGLNALITTIGGSFGSKVIGSGDIAFNIGPHINAGGRVDSAEVGLKLLLEQNPAKALHLAERLVENNNLRKELQNKGYEEALQNIRTDADRFVLVSGADIHEGVAGIVAGKLKDEFNRPALIVTKSEKEGVLKGTGRCIDSINLYDFLNTQSHLFLNFGGHRAACGFSLREEALEEFEAGLEETFDNLRADNPGILDEIVKIDSRLKLSEATNAFGWEIEKLEPFGQLNQRPLFAVERVFIKNFKLVGKEREHCRFDLYDLDGNSLECIMFGAEPQFRGLVFDGRPMDFAGRVNMNYRGGAFNIQFIPIDFRFSK